ncbi:MAG: cryptochrome/photolyase family protein, partial [Acidimicrobiia bacterium]|nr:cryptochrome/photolyase family protein [Acidimicrobiia bacterium]
METILVFGDQLNRRIGALADSDSNQNCVLMVESEQLLGGGRHVQRKHLVVAAMRRFAAELEDAGYDVDLRRAASMRAGIQAHRKDRGPDSIVATEPNSRRAQALLTSLNVETVRSNQFLCHYRDFGEWAQGRKSLKMEDFYRWTRTNLGYLMDGDEPIQGHWNFDADNRQPPPDDTSMFSDPQTSALDDIDAEVLSSLPPSHGREPTGIWATSRRAALSRLRHFVDHELATFGPYEDAMTSRSWHLSHSLLSPYLNIGLLMPDEVVEAAIKKFERGEAPIQSVEGFLRQIIGWREYVW